MVKQERTERTNSRLFRVSRTPAPSGSGTTQTPRSPAGLCKRTSLLAKSRHIITVQMKTHLKTTLPSNGIWRQKEKLQPFIWNKVFATVEPLTLYILCLLVAIFIIILKPKSWCSFRQTHTCTTPKKSPYNVCFLSLTKSHALLRCNFPLGWTGEQELTISRYPVKGHITAWPNTQSSWKERTLTSFVKPPFLHYCYFIHNGRNVSWKISLRQKITVEISELQQKCPQRGSCWVCRFPPSRLLLKGSKEESTVIWSTSHGKSGIQQGVAFIARLFLLF